VRAARSCIATSASAYGCSQGGHLDSDEDPSQAALRETKRKPDFRSGILQAVRVSSISMPTRAGAHFHLDLRYLLLSADLDPAPAPAESQDVAWFSIEQAVELADEALVDGLKRLSMLDTSKIH